VQLLPLQAGTVGNQIEATLNDVIAFLPDSVAKAARTDGHRRYGLATTVDDVTPEELGGLQERLTDAGALDVTAIPATMKKSRPGHLLKVITRPEHADRVTRRLAEETGTLGVREAGGGHRMVADRELETVTVEVAGRSAPVDVKVASIDGEVFDVSAEFDDTLAAAADSDVPVRELRRRAEAVVHDRLD